MFDALTDPFSGSIGTHALIAVVLLAITCGPLGVWIVLYRQSYAAESIAHAALPGLVLAALTSIPLVVGAGAGLLVAALAVAVAGRLRGVGADLAVAVVVTSLLGLGTLLALSPDVPPRLGELLFGDPLSVTDGDLIASAVVAIVVLVALGALHRPLALAGFDAQSARSLGASPATIETALLAILALTTLVAIQALGNLLVVAALIAPGAAALRMVRGLRGALVLGAALALVGGLGGLYASYYLDIAAGAAIALSAIAVYCLTLPFRRGSGGRPAPARSPVEALAAGR
jgi:ABC-type Mn2+/Zn2+ transport system permease subunit